MKKSSSPRSVLTSSHEAKARSAAVEKQVRALQRGGGARDKSKAGKAAAVIKKAAVQKLCNAAVDYLLSRSPRKRGARRPYGAQEAVKRGYITPSLVRTPPPAARANTGAA